MKNDEDLYMAYCAGEKEALDRLYQRYDKRIFNYALRLLGNRADAEDVVGELFYRVTSRKDAYRVQARFRTWLYTVARNLCLDRIRRRKRFVVMWSRRGYESDSYEQWEIPDYSNIPADLAAQSDVARLVKNAIAKLPRLQREAIILREYQKLSYEEIRTVLKVSGSKVKILIFRARQKLGKALSPLLKEVRDV